MSTPVCDLVGLTPDSPVLDTEAIKKSLALPPAPTPQPAHPLSGAAPALNVPTEIAFEKQDPIYLLPEQASAQGAFLATQQAQPLLGAFLRRILLIPTKGA